MTLRILSLASTVLLAALALVPVSSAFAQATPGFATVERVYPVGEQGTRWRQKCGRNITSDPSARPGFYDRDDRFEHDRPEAFARGRRQCIQVPQARGSFVGYRARVIEQGRIFDQFVSSTVRPGDRVRVALDAGFVGYDEKAHKARPDRDWGDNYFPGYPYGARY